MLFTDSYFAADQWNMTVIKTLDLRNMFCSPLRGNIRREKRFIRNCQKDSSLLGCFAIFLDSFISVVKERHWQLERQAVISRGLQKAVIVSSVCTAVTHHPWRQAEGWRKRREAQLAWGKKRGTGTSAAV